MTAAVGPHRGRNTPPRQLFSPHILAYLAEHAIDPGVAAELGVRERDGRIVYPCSSNGARFERTRDLKQRRTFQPSDVGLDLWWPADRNGWETVLLAEGEPDALAAISALRHSPLRDLRDLPVAAVPGTGFPAKRLAEQLAKAGIFEAFLGFDADSAGRAYAKRAIATLGDFGIRSIAIELPDGQDLADWLSAVESWAERGEQLASLLCDCEAAAFSGDHGSEDRSLSTAKESAVVQGKDGLPFAPITQALADVPSEPEWVWEGFIAPASITLIAGVPKVGKSTLAFALIAALINGRSFVGLETKLSRVVLLSEERPPTLTEKRERFGLSESVDLLMRHQVPDGMTWPEIVAQAVDRCRELSAALLVVDTWDKWSGLRGDDESKTGAVLEALAPLQRAAGEGLAVLILPHQRKAPGSHGEAVKGNNALTGGVDVVIELERAPVSMGAQASVRVLRAVSRFSSTPEELAAELTADGYRACGDLGAVKRDTELTTVCDALARLGTATAQEVAQETGMSEASGRRRLNELHELGRALRQGEGRKNSPFRFGLSDILSTSPSALADGRKGVGDSTDANVPDDESTAEGRL